MKDFLNKFLLLYIKYFGNLCQKSCKNQYLTCASKSLCLYFLPALTLKVAKKNFTYYRNKFFIFLYLIHHWYGT